MLAPMIFRF